MKVGECITHANNYGNPYVQYRKSLTYVADSNELRSTYWSAATTVTDQE